MDLLAVLLSTVLLATGSVPAAHDSDPGLGTAPARAPSAHGVWPLPAPHPVVHGFSPPASAWGAGHRGVDLGGLPGESVRAALGGRVSFAAVIAGRGVVVIAHGQRRTTYEPVTASVAVGDEIAAGTNIGTLEVTHSHCFPRACLHWGYLEGQAYLDPLTLVGVQRVRLLPPA